MKILILKPSSLGDVVQALPVLRLIKLRYPGSEIYWWLDSGLLPLLEKDPDLTGLIPFHRRGWASPRNWGELIRSVFELRRRHFDWVIDLQGLARTGIIAWLANGDLLAGVDEPREGARGFYDLIVRRPSPQTHAVDWYLEFLPVLGVPAHRDFTWIPARPEIRATLGEKWNPDSARWIVLSPGARWLNKRWAIQNFCNLAARLAVDLPGHRFAVLGSKSERHLGDRILSAIGDRCLNLAGETSLPEMVEWIRLSDLMISNDTGPMHVATAIGKPTVAIFGPTDPRRTGPYGQLDGVVRWNLPCAPCLQDHCDYEKPTECLQGISTEQVRRKVLARLGR